MAVKTNKPLIVDVYGDGCCLRYKGVDYEMAFAGGYNEEDNTLVPVTWRNLNTGKLVKDPSLELLLSLVNCPEKDGVLPRISYEGFVDDHSRAFVTA
jgi:hypothetical protein